MFNWLRKRTPDAETALRCDIHSHLLPGLDDGVQSFEQAEAIIARFHHLGYQHLVTTPHIISDLYRNTPQTILSKLDELRLHLKTKNIPVTIDAAAEYYLDEELLNMLRQNTPLLTFSPKKYLLFETSFLNEPFILKDFIFRATAQGYTLVMAHPERYVYLQSASALSKVEDLLSRGVLMQVNISSITGYYSKAAQTAANRLIDKGWVHFLGSDCHHLQHAKLVEEALRMKYFQKALSLPLLNNTLAEAGV